MTDTTGPSPRVGPPGSGPDEARTPGMALPTPAGNSGSPLFRSPSGVGSSLRLVPGRAPHLPIGRHGGARIWHTPACRRRGVIRREEWALKKERAWGGARGRLPVATHKTGKKRGRTSPDIRPPATSARAVASPVPPRPALSRIAALSATGTKQDACQLWLQRAFRRRRLAEKVQICDVCRDFLALRGLFLAENPARQPA